jgi:hypothetical protein
VGSPQDAYFALWVLAYEDVLAALPHAVALRQSDDAERRFVVTHFLTQVRLIGSFRELLSLIEDTELRIAAHAAIDLTSSGYKQELLANSDLFERLERLIQRLPHKQVTTRPLVWDWMTLRSTRDHRRQADRSGERSQTSIPCPHASLIDRGFPAC